MHQQTSVWFVLAAAALLAATPCCRGETVSRPVTTVNSNSTDVPKAMLASTSPPPPPVPTIPEMPPLIFPKEKANATNTTVLQQRLNKLNQTLIVVVSNNASEKETKAMGPEYYSPGSDKAAVAVHSNPLEMSHYETHPDPNPVNYPEERPRRPVVPSEPSHEARVQKPPSSLGRMPFSEPSKSAAILAGILASVALVGYVGLFLWRRFLERRYGSREMLVNDDDCYDASDPKSFEL